jgi:capsid protein
MSWYQSHRLYQIFQHRDNDIFTRLYYSQERGLLNPLQWEFIDPNQIRGDTITTTSLVNATSADGIDRDERNREVRYHIWVFESSSQRFREVTVPRKGPKSGRYMMLHGYTPDYAGQGRGYSRLAHALQEFSDLTDFTLATIKKAINQSQITMYVKPSQDAPASNPVEDLLTNAGAGPAAKQFGANPEPSDDAANVASVNPVSFYEMPEATMTEPGSTAVFNLEAGEDIRAFENKIAAESYDRFVDSFCSYLCASSSMPLEVLLMKFNQNYSASRGTLLLFWRVATIWREEMITSYCNPTYEMWLAGEIAANRISCPGWSDPRMRAAWLNARWVGTPMPNIDPDKTASADMKYVEMGAQTLERVARNHNGSSGKANRAALKREIGELTPVPWSKNAADEGKPKRKDDEEG